MKITEHKVQRSKKFVIQVEDEFGSVTDLFIHDGNPEDGMDKAQKQFDEAGIGAKRITAIPYYGKN